MRRSDQSAIEAEGERKEINSLIRTARLMGVPLPRSPQDLNRALAAGLQEIVRTGQLPPSDFFVTYAQKARKPYQKTPARRAASLANLQKAQAALKAKGYQLTAKRQAANLANLAKAHAARREEAARLVGGLKQAFPAPRGGVKAGQGKTVEKVGRTILRRWGSVRRGVRREGRRVMGLLRRAAARGVPAGLAEWLGLAASLMAVLADGRLVERMEKLNGRIGRLLGALAEKRYGNSARLSNLSQAGLRRAEGAPRFAGGGEGVRAPGPRRADDTQQAAASPGFPPGAPDGLDLPQKFEDFQALLDGAFFAPQPPPAEGELRPLLDQLAQTLWERLHVFDVVVEDQKQRLERELEAMAEREEALDLAERRARLERVLAAEGARQYQTTIARDCRQWLGGLMRLRYGPDPGIERFAAQSDGPME